MHSSIINLAISSAYSFLSISVPFARPQKPSLLLCACLQKALAPTVSLGGYFNLFSSSSATTIRFSLYLLRTVFNLLKF